MLREMGDADGALAACDRALGSVDADTGDAALRRARAEVLHARGVLLRRVGRTREAIDAHASAIAIFRQTKAVRQEARSKGALAFALYTQNRLEDAISLSLEAIRIMVSLGARIHIAQPLSLIARCYGQLGDLPRARAYFDRALQTHDRAADREGHAETMIFRVEALIGHGAVKDAAEAFQKAAQHVHQGSSIYDRTLLDLVDAQWHLATGRLPEAVHLAETTRRSAEAQTIASVHLYALALESVARAELGEVHTATRLASTALGTLESLQGTEYGLEVRVLCARALQRSGSPEAAMAWTRAASFARAKLNSLRDARFRRMFAQRPLIQDLLTSTANASIRPS
jgi:tetratricopeptide (TPR) repeat protein